MSRTFPILVALLLACGMGCAKVEVVDVPSAASPGAGLAGEDGVFYALPRTVVRVLVKADQTVTRSARFARFAPIFAPGSTPPCGSITACAVLGGGPGERKAYKIQQGSTFATFGEPDPTKVYMVKFARGGTLDQKMAMEWNEAGLLSTASASVTNRTTDVVVSSIKLAASLGTKFAALGSPIGAAAVQASGCEALPARPSTAAAAARQDNDSWVLPILLQAEADASRNILVANYCDLPATGQDVDSRDDYSLARDQAPLRAAMLAYLTRVAPLVDQRTAILTTGTVNALDPIALIDRLDSLIDEQMKALFVGSKTVTTWDMPFEVRQFEPNQSVELVHVVPDAGLCTPGQWLAHDARPAPDGMLLTSCPNTRTPVVLQVAYHPEMDQQLFHRVQTGTSPPPG